MYEIRVLSNEEFNALPYKDVSESLGLADTKHRVAYVRQTNVKGLDEGTINHEFDELLQRISPHEIDGIRYKKGGFLRQIVPPLLSLIPGIGPILGVTSKVGMDEYARSRHPEQLGKPGTFKGIGSSALQGYGGGKIAGGALKGFQKAGSGFLTKAAGVAKGAAGLTGAQPTSLPIQGANSSGIGIGSGGGAGIGAGIGAGGSSGVGVGVGFGAGGGAGIGSGISSSLSAPASAAIASKVTISPLAKFSKNLASSALTKSLAPTQARPLTLGQNYVQQQASSGGSLGRFGQGLFNVNDTNGQYGSAINEGDITKGLSRIDENAAKRTKSVFDMFRRIRPGSSIEGDTAFQQQLADIQTSTSSEKESFRGEAKHANEQKYLADRYYEIRKLNNLSNSQMKNFINLSRGPDKAITQAINMNPSEFRALFKGLEQFA